MAVLVYGLDSQYVSVRSWHYLLFSGTTKLTKLHLRPDLQLSQIKHQLLIINILNKSTLCLYFYYMNRLNTFNSDIPFNRIH